MKNAPFIDDPRLKHMFKIAAVSDGFSVRHVAMLTVLYGTGRMLIEKACRPLKAYLRPDGGGVDESTVTPDVADKCCWA